MMKDSRFICRGSGEGRVPVAHILPLCWAAEGMLTVKGTVHRTEQHLLSVHRDVLDYSDMTAVYHLFQFECDHHLCLTCLQHGSRTNWTSSEGHCFISVSGHYRDPSHTDQQQTQFVWFVQSAADKNNTDVCQLWLTASITHIPMRDRSY